MQANFDIPVCKYEPKSLVEDAASLKDKARILSAPQPHSGYWLEAFPIAGLILKMENSQFCIASALQFAAKICQDDTCICCKISEQSGTYGL